MTVIVVGLVGAFLSGIAVGLLVSEALRRTEEEQDWQETLKVLGSLPPYTVGEK